MNDFSQMTVEDYMRILNKRKWWIIIPLIIFHFAGHVIVRILPKVYVANTLVLVESQKVPSAYVQSTVTSQVEERLKTIQEEVMSRSRLYEIIERFKLFPDMRDSHSIDQLIAKMRKAIKIQIRHKDAFAIYYEGRDPKTVAQVANAITEQFINANLKLREEQARETANFLEEMLRDQQEILVKRETALAEFLRLHAGALPEHTERNLRLIEQLNLQMATKQESLKAATEEKKSLELQLFALEEMAPEEMEDSTKAVLRQKLADLEGTLSILKLTYTDSHPKVLLLKNQIDNLTSLIYNTNDSEGSITEKTSQGGGPEKTAQLNEKLNGTSEKLSKLENELSNLKQKIKTQEDLLKSQEEKWADFLEIHPDILPEPISQNLQLIEQLNVQIMTKQVAIKKENEMRISLESQIIKSETQPAILGSRDPKIVEMNKAKSNLENEITLLKATYNESHPILQGKLKEIEHINVTIGKLSLEKKEREAKNKVVISIQEEKMDELKKKLMQVREFIGSLEQDQIKIQEKIKTNHLRVDNAPNLEVDLKELNRQYAQERKQYEELLEKNLDAELARKMELRQKGEQFIRLDEAIPPRSPFKPDKNRILLMSAVLGIGLGLGLAFVREFFDASFSISRDVEKTLKVPVLASIPHIDEFDTKKRFRFWSKKKNVHKISAIVNSSNDLSIPDQNFQNSIQEIYRILKVKLEHHCKNKQRGNLFLVTSTEPGEGKTTTAIHLAWIMSQGLGKKVALLDCDFYKPKIASSFDIQSSKGLCEYFSGKAAIPDILVPIQLDKLYVITTGKTADKSEDLLESKEMQKLLDDLRTEFDYVILDIPSVMATVHEVNVLTPKVDHILFVVRAEKTKRNVVLQSLGLLNKDKLLGVVLNNAKTTKRSTYDRYVQYKQNEPLEASIPTTVASTMSDPGVKKSATITQSKFNGQAKEKVNGEGANIVESIGNPYRNQSLNSTSQGTKHQGNRISEKNLDGVGSGIDLKKETHSGEKPHSGRIPNYLSSSQAGPKIPRNGELDDSRPKSSSSIPGGSRIKNERIAKKTIGPNLIPNPLRSAKNDLKASQDPNSAKTYIRMILDDKEGNPYAHKSYKLVVDGKEYAGRTNSKGLVDEEIPANSQKGELSLRVNDRDPSEVLIWPLHISKSS